MKYIFGILESKWFEIRIDNNYLVFFFCRRKNVSLVLKRKNYYNYIYIKKKMWWNLKYIFLFELREFVLDLLGFFD